MSKILVTGGAGFIGSHLCRRLLKETFEDGLYPEIICVDNLYTGSLDNIKDLERNPRFKFVKGDITNTFWVRKCEDFKNVTHIFNCACPASPVHYQGKHSIDTTMTCIVGIKNLLDLATKYKARIMQFSTSEVYGDPAENYLVQPESYRGNVNCTGPRACYDEGKRCAESLCYDYNRTFGTDVRVIRIFNTYGPYMNKDDGRVVSNFICQALKNEDITIYGEGNQSRSFCYITDLIEGIITVMKSGYKFPVNLGNPSEYTMNEVAKLVLDLLPNSTSSLVYKALPKDDPTHRRPDISIARGMGWKPDVSLIKGLVLTIDYFKKILNIK